MALHRVTVAKDIPPGEARAFDVAGRRIAVFNTGDAFLAIDDECTHDGGPLSEGSVEGTCVTCPWHGAEFDLSTGEVLTPPAVENVRSYQVVISDGEISIEIE